MDKKYLKENNLYEGHKHFMRLCEWSYISRPIEEEGDDENNPLNKDNPMGGGNSNMPQQNGGIGDKDDMGTGNQDDMPQGDGGLGDDMPPMGNDGQMNGGDMPSMGGDEPMNGGDMPSMDDDEPMLDDPMMDDMGEDEDVIDVDDITDAQEKMNDKINAVGKNLGQVSDKIEALMQSISNMEQMINNNNAEIELFKQEFEKRNPTQTEKLNLRSLDSYPFNVSPKEYWEKKGLDPNSNYSGYGDNNESTTQEYEITNSDVDDFDERTISDSFSVDDDMKQSIEKIFGL